MGVYLFRKAGTYFTSPSFCPGLIPVHLATYNAYSQGAALDIHSCPPLLTMSDL